MADDNKHPPPQSAPEHQVATPVTPHDHPGKAHVDNSDRSQLVSRARAFLTSPQVAHEDVPSKRAFLVAKGLAAPEIEQLLAEVPPLVPPRSYPVPPPSNLPHLLAGVARVFSFVAGGSVLLSLVYMRYILPRLTRSLQARHALNTHQRGLLGRFADSIEDLKMEQANAFTVLPASAPANVQEEKRFAACHSLDELLALADTDEKRKDLQSLSVVRCAIEEFTAREKRAPSTDDLLLVLHVRAPWLDTDSRPLDEASLEASLRALPVFSSIMKENHECWVYTALPPAGPSPQLVSLTSLSAAVPRANADASPRRTQHLLQALAGLTGFLTSHVYGLASSGPRTPFGGDVRLTPEAEEVRREIRALKGLVLNRRSFMASASSATHAATTAPVSVS